jgi:hypothetical protein
MRFSLLAAISVMSLVMLSACSTSPRYGKAAYAEIAAYVDPGCEHPSARFRELRDDKNHAVKFSDTGLRVRPGVYAIGLSCGTVFDRDLGRCIGPEGNVAEQDVPTYKLIIRTKVRYLFSCLQENGVWTYHMVESDL